MDRFPEAFKRFEQVVDTSKLKSWQELLSAFRYWSGRRWKETPLQLEALKIEAWKLGLPPIEDILKLQKRISELYRRVYYCKRRLDYNKLVYEGWIRYHEGIVKRAKKEMWKPEHLELATRHILRKLETSRKRFEYWQSEHQKAYEQLKEAHDRLTAFRKRLIESGRRA